MASKRAGISIRVDPHFKEFLKQKGDEYDLSVIDITRIIGRRAVGEGKITLTQSNKKRRKYTLDLEGDLFGMFK